MDTLATSTLLSVGKEDAIFISLAAVVLLYFVAQRQSGIPEHEKAQLQELFSIPQQRLHPQGVPSTLQAPSRNICDFIKSSPDVGAVVFWASQSGTAEALASRYASELSAGFSFRVMNANLADYDHKHMLELPSQTLLVFILSTFGAGDPPDNGVALLESLYELRKQGRDLNNVRYVMFGLGNSNYVHFNKYALDVDSELGKLGAVRLSSLGLGDDRKGATEEDFITWKQETTQAVAKALDRPIVKGAYSPRLKIRPSHKGTKRGMSPNIYDGEPPYAIPTAEMSAIAALPVIRSQRLDHQGESIGKAQDSRQCVHMEFGLDGHPSVTYETGDYLCIWPINPEHEVEKLLRTLGIWSTRQDIVDILPLDGVAASTTRIPTPTTMESLFRYYLDICGPVSRELLGDIADFITNREVKARLEALTSNRESFHSSVTSKRLTLAAVLELVTDPQSNDEATTEIPVSYILENLKKLQPRSYSISSSAIVDPRAIAITALAVNDPPQDISATPYRFRGLTSNYLLQLQQESSRGDTATAQQLTSFYSTAGPRNLLQGGKVFARIRRSGFKLPQDPSTPIIMVGSGTGVAPFRAFVQERMTLKKQGLDVGKTVLIVGHRAPDQDYYYRDLWQEARKALGDAFEVHTAFSRVETQPRQYVQDVLATRSDSVLSILAANRPNIGGVLYICGSSLMANGVKNSLAEMWSRAARESGGSPESNADEWLSELGRLRRLQEDSWG